MIDNFKSDMCRVGLADYLRTEDIGIFKWEGRKVIYMKPAKTAGTSLLKLFFEKLGPHAPTKVGRNAERNRWLSTITDESLQEYFICSFTRNPWDRYVSLISYFKINDRVIFNNPSKIPKHMRESVRIHSLPCNMFTHIGGERYADFIGRYENLQEDFDRLCGIIGVESSIIPIANASKRKYEHYSRHYDTELKNLVGDKYKEDISLFNYTF